MMSAIPTATNERATGPGGKLPVDTASNTVCIESSAAGRAAHSYEQRSCRHFCEERARDDQSSGAPGAPDEEEERKRAIEDQPELVAVDPTDEPERELYWRALGRRRYRVPQEQIY
jgi:hypothetical protein